MISVVIRSYNEEKHIGRLLSGLLQQTVAPQLEVIVVDSGSTDRTVDIATAHGARVVRIAPSEFSFGRSLNVGCEASSGDVLVFASAHVYPVYRDWIERLVTPLQTPAVAVAYGKQRGADVSRYSERQVFARWFPDGAAGVQDGPFCNNANAAVRKDVWSTLRFDESLTGLEDIDFAHRAIASGRRVAYQPDAEIIHVHEETPRRIFARYRREAIALHRIFPHERFGALDFVRLFISNAASDCYHALRERVFARELPGIVVFRLMQFAGTWRGFAQRGPITSELRERFYYPNGLSRSRGDARSDDPSRRIEYEKVGA